MRMREETCDEDAGDTSATGLTDTARKWLSTLSDGNLLRRRGSGGGGSSRTSKVQRDEIEASTVAGVLGLWVGGGHESMNLCA